MMTSKTTLAYLLTSDVFIPLILTQTTKQINTTTQKQNSSTFLNIQDVVF